MTTLKSLQSIAKRYRRDPLTPAGGVVLIYRDEVYGWKNILGTPSSEKPGAFAVDESGGVWLAEGGDDYHGAKSWVPFSPLPGKNLGGSSLAAPAVCHAEGTPQAKSLECHA